MIILSAPSGCGKTTVLSRLLKRHPDWVRSVSITTRVPRPEEENGIDYQFVAPKEFETLKEKKEFLEWARVFKHLYGTPLQPITKGVEAGHPVILTVDVQGHRSIRKTLTGKVPLLSIFILPPSIQVLRERLEKRSTDPAKEIESRIRIAEEEIKMAREYDATVLNHDLDQTTHEIEALILDFEKKLGFKQK